VLMVTVVFVDDGDLVVMAMLYVLVLCCMCWYCVVCVGTVLYVLVLCCMCLLTWWNECGGGGC